MKFIAISDLHGNLINIGEEADVLLIAGDIIPLEYQNNLEKSKEWFEKEFIPWCNSISVNTTVFIGGNHDKWIEEKPIEVVKSLPNNIVYLLNQFKYIETDTSIYCIYGTPLCSIFGHWSFMYPENVQRELLNIDINKNKSNLKLIHNTTKDIKLIVLSHDSPLGCSDVLLDKTCPWYTDK